MLSLCRREASAGQLQAEIDAGFLTGWAGLSVLFPGLHSVPEVLLSSDRCRRVSPGPAGAWGPGAQGRELAGCHFLDLSLPSCLRGTPDKGPRPAHLSCLPQAISSHCFGGPGL